MTQTFTYHTNCVSSDGRSITEMVDAAREITINTFRRHCQWRDVAEQLGYDRDFTMSSDWHISYYRSKFRGKRCYFFKWSAIEYVFLET